MNLLSITLLFAIGVIAAFVALNWGVFTASTTLNLGFAEIQAPLGLTTLGIVAVLAALFLGYVVYLQTSVLMEARRHAKELHEHRRLADEAEASRFTELRRYLETEAAQQVALESDASKAVLARLDRLEQELQTAIEQNGNSLAAQLGEIEDRLAADKSTSLSRRNI